VGKANIEMPFSKVKLALAKILGKENFLGSIEEKGKKSSHKISIN